VFDTRSDHVCSIPVCRADVSATTSCSAKIQRFDAIGRHHEGTNRPAPLIPAGGAKAAARDKASRAKTTSSKSEIFRSTPWRQEHFATLGGSI
jgi:hypothetical protein